MHSPIDRRRRWQVLCLNVAASGGARAVSFACTLVQVGVLVRALGETGYGVWVTLLAVATAITSIDFGAGTGLQTGLAEARARGDETRVRRLYGSGLVTFAVLGVAFILLGTTAALTLNLDKLWHLAGTPYADSARPALLIVVFVFSLGVPLNTASLLAGALQLGRLQSLWMAAGTAVALLVAVAADRFHWPWLILVAALSAIPLLQNAALLVHLWRHLNWPATWPAPLPWREWKPVLTRSLLLAGPQLGLALVQAAPPLALAAVGGPPAAAAFNLLQRLANPLLQALWLFLGPLWPTYVEADARGDTHWPRRMLLLSLSASLACVLVLVGLVAARGTLLALWVGPGFTPPSASLAWLATAWFGLCLCTQPLYFFLVGVQRWRQLSLSGAAGHGLTLAGMWLGGRLAGAEGVLWGAIAGFGGVWLPALVATTLRALHRHPLPVVPVP